MASIYPRGNRLWARIKGWETPGEWSSLKTDYTVGQEEQAKRWAGKAEQEIAARGAPGGPLTLERYATGEPHGGRGNWVERRKAMDVGSWQNEESRLRIHILPVLGKLALTEIRAVHVRDFVRALIASKKLGAARTIREVYATLSRLFTTAVEDELIESNPCQLRRGSRELPKRRDADPAWRGEATYTQNEVERLISVPVIPHDARVLYALKSIAMLRHGEACVLRFSDYDPAFEPLGRFRITRAYDSRGRRVKGTKSGEPRMV